MIIENIVGIDLHFFGFHAPGRKSHPVRKKLIQSFNRQIPLPGIIAKGQYFRVFRDFRDFFNPRRVELDSYFVLDAAVSYTADVNRGPLRKVKIFAKGQNILDEDYEEVFGFSAPGARFLAGFNFTF